ncbi:Retinol dehydrogenase 12 [Orchesella cincta]|uniref:Retinol dehydrogenase 12 n=1 Tax=Orchesella cincta TaxID=48709 RepID=A0A1D2NAJ5_ORCCI|nr:Retinol dehydrogenase 12 [Orchesella cincta]
MVLLSTLGYVGAAVVGVGWVCRIMFSRNFETHDASDEEDVQGKVVLITGANSGLGKVTTFEMAKRGAKIIMASRNLELTNSVVAQVRKMYPSSELTAMKLDLGSLESVREFAKEVQAKFDKIDILINNAGVYAPLKKQMKTVEGYEFNFGVNHVGHFLLTNLLLDLVKAAAPSRIVVVSSRRSDSAKLSFDDLMLEKENPETSKIDPYSNSKYANLLFAKELSNRLQGTNVNVYALCPGWVKTDLARYADLTWKQYIIMVPVAFIFMRTPRQGAQTILHCALSRKVRQETGQFYRDCTHWSPKSAVTDEAAQQMWTVSESLAKLK